MGKYRILFVCMGNICRSPLAEGVFLHEAARRGVRDRFLVDSAGTGGWHAGERPDERAREVAARHGIKIDSTARQIRTRDFKDFDLLICMDADNRDDLLDRGAPADRIRLLLEFDPDAPLEEVPDPYYGAADGFDLVFRLVQNACNALLDALVSKTVES